MKFKDPFRSSEKQRDMTGGASVKKLLDEEMGESMLRGGSDRIGKGVGVWRVE